MPHSIQNEYLGLKRFIWRENNEMDGVRFVEMPTKNYKTKTFVRL